MALPVGYEGYSQCLSQLEVVEGHHHEYDSSSTEDSCWSEWEDEMENQPPVVKISPWRKVRSAVQWSPFVQTFRRQRYPWVQLAGHQGNFKIGGERGTILKKLCPVEENCFQLLMQDPLRPFIPKYKGHIIADDGERNRLN